MPRPRFLGIIPARGGSKRLKRKNLTTLCGKPLIAWTIEAAKKSKLDHVIVSTEDKEIGMTAEKYGAWVPFIRPEILALDESKTIDVLLHAVSAMEDHYGLKPDYIMTLQPTTPTRTERDINVAIDFLSDAPLDCFFTTIEEDLKPNGNIYCTSYDLLTKDRLIWHTLGALWPQNNDDYPDIDTKEDLERAERILCQRYK